MKYINIILLFIFLGHSAISQTKPKTAKPAPKKVTKTPAKGKTFSISGQVVHTYEYCGGMEPTPEMVTEGNTPRPYSGKKFYVRKGNVNTTKAAIAGSFITDDNGNFSLSLPAGTYSIIVEEQLNTISAKDLKRDDVQVDEDCLKAWWAKPYHLLQVKKDITGLKFSFHHRCFIKGDVPCTGYTGPMPP